MPLLRKDERIGEGPNAGRWCVVRKVGDGGFAEVYEVKDTFHGDERYAMKIDKLDKKKDARGGTVKPEYKMMKRLQICPQVCRLVDDGFGTHEGRCYLIMELLGANLAQVLRCSSDGRFDADTTVSIGLAVLGALEALHAEGVIHRDVKPANFCLALHKNPSPPANGYNAATASPAQPLREWRAIDFGIARRFVDDLGAVAPARPGFAEFRGSTSYASVNAHHKLDLGRRDDLWSWLYMVVEMLDGSLPWRAGGSPPAGGAAPDAPPRELPKEAALRKKQACLAEPGGLCTALPLPDGLRSISMYLAQLRFESEPDYGHLRSCLKSILPRSGPARAPPEAAANGWPPHAPAHPTTDAGPAILDTPLSPPDEDRGLDPVAGAGAGPAGDDPRIDALGATAPAQALNGAVAACIPQRNGLKRLRAPDNPWPAGQAHSRHVSPAGGSPAVPLEAALAAKRSRLAPMAAGHPGLSNSERAVATSSASRGASPGTEPRRQHWRAQGAVPWPGPAESDNPSGPGGALEVDEMVAAVAAGHISAEAAEVKERLRRLDPAEGLGIFAWVFRRLARDTAAANSAQVARWFEEFSILAKREALNMTAACNGRAKQS